MEGLGRPVSVEENGVSVTVDPRVEITRHKSILCLLTVGASTGHLIGTHMDEVSEESCVRDLSFGSFGFFKNRKGTGSGRNVRE